VGQVGAPGSATIMRELFDTFYTRHGHPFYEAIEDKVPAQFHWIPDIPHSMPWHPSRQRGTVNLIVSFLAKDCGLSSGRLQQPVES